MLKPNGSICCRAPQPGRLTRPAVSARELLQRCAHAPLQNRAGGPMVEATRMRIKGKLAPRVLPTLAPPPRVG